MKLTPLDRTKLKKMAEDAHKQHQEAMKRAVAVFMDPGPLSEIEKVLFNHPKNKSSYGFKYKNQE